MDVKISCPVRMGSKNILPREIFKYIALELRTFDLKNRVCTFWYKCSQYLNKMVKVHLTSIFYKYTLMTDLIV